MKLRLPIYVAAAAAAILTATAAQVRAQDDLDALRESVRATPTPAAVQATPRPTSTAAATSISRAPIQTTAATTPPRTATTTAPRPTAAPAAPRETVKGQLAHGTFVSQGDLSSMAGKKVGPNTFLVGQWKATGNTTGGRKEFADAALFGSGKTKLLIRFPVAPDPRVLVAGSSTKWEKAAPLRVESVSSTKDGITIYATDVTP